MKLINEEHFVSGSQDGYVVLLSVLPSNKQFGDIITAGLYHIEWYIVTCLLLWVLLLPSNKQLGYIVTAGLYHTEWYIVTCLLLQFLEHLAVPDVEELPSC